MKEIEVKIKLAVPAKGTLLLEINNAIQKCFEENGIDFYHVDTRIKLDDNE
jgi:hypothetical protein